MLLKAKPKTEAIQLKTMTLVNQTSPFCSKSHGSAAEKQFRDFHIMFVTTMVPSIETPVTKASALSQFRILNVSCWVSDSLCHIFCHQMFSTGTHVSAYQCHIFPCSTWLRSTVSTPPVSATPKFQIFTSCVSFTPVFVQLWHSSHKEVSKGHLTWMRSLPRLSQPVCKSQRIIFRQMLSPNTRLPPTQAKCLQPT